MTIQAAHSARRLLAGKEGFETRTRAGKLVIVVGDRFAVTIKKMTRRRNPKTGRMELRRSNYLTPANQDYWDQRQAGEFADYPRVILGYELLRELTELRVLLAYPRTRGRGVEWEVSIPPQVVKTPEIYLPQSEAVVTASDDKGFTIEAREPGQLTGEKGAKAE